MAATKSSSGRKYSRAAGKSVKSAMHREKQGTLRRGPGGHGGKVTDPKQAIAIGLNEAREKGAKVPAARKSSAKKSSARKSTAKRSTAKKSAAKKSSTKKAAAKKSGAKRTAAKKSAARKSA